jgi:hypothetical protein
MGSKWPSFTSTEVMQDHDLGDIEAAASKKYDKGEIEPNGTVCMRTTGLQ